MDFHHFVHFAKETDADVAIASLPIGIQDVGRMGILDINERLEVVDFHEKPKDSHILEKIKMQSSLTNKLEILNGSEKPFLGSMGIYLFKRQALIDLLQHTTHEDFGKHLIPEKVKKGKVSAFIYDGYWEDIGTIESFYKANMALTRREVPFNFHDEYNPIYTRQNTLPGTIIHNTLLSHSIICEGGIIEADEITNSILGPRTVVKRGSRIRNSYVMGNEFYNPPIPHTLRFADQLLIGEDCTIENAILDQNVCIGNRVKLINKANLSHYDGNSVCIRDGIIIVMRGAHIHDDFIL
jgi:glucose-1-phosphate adenylyltransferase